MKKGILISLALLAGFTTFSQDYQCIRDNATYFYSDGTNIKAIQIDSVVNTNEGLIYYNYPTIVWDNNTNCYDRFGPSWIGRKVLVNANGDNIFYNKNNQTLTIKTLKYNGEYWTCYTFSNSDYIRATILEISEMQFLGLTDTVKKITFQAYDSNGTPISHTINNKYLLLSKNYGLIRAINFKLFPNLADFTFYNEYCTEFSLAGVSNPALGIENLTADKVYNFEVGDEIDTRRDRYGFSNYYQGDRFKKYILQKNFNANYDSVSYLISRCGWTETHIPYEGVIYFYYHDTLTGKYFIGDDSIINVLPDKVILVYEDPYSNYIYYSVVLSSFYETSGKIMKKEVTGFYFDPAYDCIIIGDEWGNDDRIFIEGLGRYYNYYQAWDCSESTYPVYFKKGNEEWGTPYSFNCDDFVTSEDEITISQKEVLISPNPMGDWARLTVDNPENKEYQFQLFNSMGVLVKEYQFQTNDLIIPRENLGNGIYFYLLTDGLKVRQSGKLVIR
jgi:hypothetical protein